MKLMPRYGGRFEPTADDPVEPIVIPVVANDVR